MAALSCRLSDLEFVVAWARMRMGTVPRPFVFTSRTPLLADYRRERAEAAERLRATWGSSLDDGLAAMACPDIRVVITGWRGDERDPRCRIARLAVRSGDRGFVIDQEPGETLWHSVAFTIIAVDALGLAEVVSRTLPEQPAGSLGRLEPRHGDGFDHFYATSPAHEPTYDHDADHWQRFAESRVSGAGVIEIEQGRSRFGPRGITRRRLEWRDLDRDGRYAIVTPDSRPVFEPVDRNRLAALINTEIAEVVRAIKDERV
ncbi:ESX secretion-associated protein EspG [Nocardia puris]|uniref:ESAT-6 protein secretion system EspG family protein n=2 Tax=Nocardia puris TaxID=208602 RepID=A0A366DFR1_9NOCA|nr:ESX secretion-associated protein EspG [Nocardia puris]RBO88917.1 ESAT-6 protein secretion system EspG family protein [Nocardia puris]